MENLPIKEHREVSRIERLTSKLRYRAKMILSKSFRDDVQLAKRGLADSELAVDQIKNILTYHKAVVGFVEVDVENRAKDLAYVQKLQDKDARITIIGKMGVVGGENEISIGINSKGKLMYSNVRDSNIRLWRAASDNKLDNAVRGVAGAINVPLKFYSEYMDPRDIGIAIKGVDLESVKGNYAAMEASITSQRVYKQNTVALSSLNDNNLMNELYRNVKVERDYLLKQGYPVNSGDQMLELKFRGGDAYEFILEGNGKEVPLGTEISILRSDYEDYQNNKTTMVVGDLGDGIKLLKVGEQTKIRLGNGPSMTLEEFKKNTVMSTDQTDRVLKQYQDRDYVLTKGKVLLGDDRQTVEVAFHARTKEPLYRMTVKGNKPSAARKLDQVALNNLQENFKRPFHKEKLKEIAKITGLKLQTESIKKSIGQKL